MSLKFSLFRDILTFVLICLFICFAAFATFVLWVHFTSFGLSASKDSKLIAIFRAHREAFEKLQRMATEDAQHGWCFNSPYFEGSELNESREKAYKRLISEIRPGLTANTDYNCSMRFIFAGGGTSAFDGPEWIKGIEYVPGGHETNGALYCGAWKVNGLTNPPQWQGLLLTNLDDVQTLSANVYLRPIETNWFLFYQRTDD